MHFYCDFSNAPKVLFTTTNTVIEKFIRITHPTNGKSANISMTEFNGINDIG